MLTSISINEPGASRFWFPGGKLQNGNSEAVVDLGKSTKLNEDIIKEILSVYFDFLKNRPTSPLLKEVFLNLPNFSTHVNVQIVFDLVSNL